MADGYEGVEYGPPSPYWAKPDQPGSFGPPADLAPVSFEGDDLPLEGEKTTLADLSSSDAAHVNLNKDSALLGTSATGLVPTEVTEIIKTVGSTAVGIANAVVAANAAGAKGQAPAPVRVAQPVPVVPTVAPAVPDPVRVAQPVSGVPTVAPPVPAPAPPVPVDVTPAVPSPSPAAEPAPVPEPVALARPAPVAPVKKAGAGTYVALGLGAAALVTGVALLATSGKRRRKGTF